MYSQAAAVPADGSVLLTNCGRCEGSLFRACCECSVFTDRGFCEVSVFAGKGRPSLVPHAHYSHKNLGIRARLHITAIFERNLPLYSRILRHVVG